jgi:hypothetical protein
MSKSGKSTATSKKQEFPYQMFPFKLIHKDGKDLKDTKICYFQSQAHADKYIARCKFKQKDYELYVNPKANVEIVGKSTRRKSTQKGSRSRQSSSN